MKFKMADVYNFSNGSWYLTSVNDGPFDVIIKVEAEHKLARKIAEMIEAMPDLLEAAQEMLEVLEQIDFSQLPIKYDSCFWSDWEVAIRKAGAKL